MTQRPRSKYKKIIENFATLKTVIYLALTLDSGFLDFFIFLKIYLLLDLKIPQNKLNLQFRLKSSNKDRADRTDPIGTKDRYN